MKNKMLFIGGTGRSGTTILKKILCKNENINTVGSELRLMVDPDGITDLYTNIVERWEPFRASSALDKFSKLWAISFTTSRLPRILRGGALYIRCSPLRYRQIKVSYRQKKMLQDVLEEFFDALGVNKQDAYWYGSRSFDINPKMLTIPRVNPLDFREAINVLVKGLHYVFSTSQNSIEPSYLIDDTPYSILYQSELSSIFTDARFINIVRHPLDVYCSYKEQRWCSNGEGAIEYLKGVYRRLHEIESGSNGNLLTVKLEDLYYLQNDTVNDISSYLGLDSDNCFDVDRISNSSFERYKNQLSSVEVERLKNVFELEISRYNYE